MKTDYVCNYCGEELVVTPRIIGDRLTLLITPCQPCIARKALLASEQDWVRKKLEKERNAA